MSASRSGGLRLVPSRLRLTAICSTVRVLLF